MKKVFLFAVAAAALVACSNEELSTPEINPATSQAPVNFSVYTQRAMTRAGAPGEITTDNLTAHGGFGVFAYYTAGEQYDAKATPNFMYNQKVVKDGNAWKYEPVKYWPNEFGQKAISDETDYVSFFAYAPWTEVEPTTGNVVAANEKEQKFNIVSVNKNTATGDPMIKYVVDTDPATSVDLLWGVAAKNGDQTANPATDPYYSQGIGGNQVTITEGKPFINLVKPNDPVKDLINFNLKHALAKVKITIDYISDKATPAEGTSATATTQTSETINPEQTRIYVRNFKINGFALKGALNLNNNEGTAGEPLWKDFDGVKDLAFDEVVFQDGRKDGKEGETNGAQTNETPQGLNPLIVENYCAIVPPVAADPTANPAVEAQPAKFKPWDAANKSGKTPGVTATAQNLFGGDETANSGYFYVIPRNEPTGKVDITIAYDVETIDGALAGKISDGETHGISIENVISKTDIFKAAMVENTAITDFRAGYVYEIKIHLGMTSVKIDASVTPWVNTNETTTNLPYNQDPAQGNQNPQP